MIGTYNKNRTPLSLGQLTTLTCCRPSWMSAITKNHKSAAISLKLMIGTCNKNRTPTKFGSIDNFDMLSAILDVSHYPKSQKMAAISLKLMIGTCNKNQTPLSLGQSTTLTCCRPSWMSAITQNHKKWLPFF